MNRAISLLLLRLLVFSAAALLGLGLVAPCMTIVPGFGEMETWVRLLKPQLMHASTYSVLSGIFAMIHNHNVGMGVLLLSFSAIFPTLKLATMAWSIEDLAARRPTGVLLRFAHHAGKFSMLDVLVLALPRGGVPVAFEVARMLDAPLDVFVVRKLGVPGHAEYAMGALASGGIRVLNQDAVQQLRIPQSAIEEVARSEQQELERRERLYRDGLPPSEVQGRTVIVVDDGLATGSTMLAAVRALRARHAGRIVVAVPVAAADTCEAMRAEADAVVCATTPRPFQAVGLWYRDFEQTTDEEVRRCLARANEALAHG